jgi:hypothetical protein
MRRLLLLSNHAGMIELLCDKGPGKRIETSHNKFRALLFLLLSG